MEINNIIDKIRTLIGEAETLLAIDETINVLKGKNEEIENEIILLRAKYVQSRKNTLIGLSNQDSHEIVCRSVENTLLTYILPKIKKIKISINYNLTDADLEEKRNNTDKLHLLDKLFMNLGVSEKISNVPFDAKREELDFEIEKLKAIIEAEGGPELRVLIKIIENIGKAKLPETIVIVNKNPPSSLPHYDHQKARLLEMLNQSTNYLNNPTAFVAKIGLES